MSKRLGMTPQDRLQFLRDKKRLAELRAKRNAANPFDQFDEGNQPSPTTTELAQRVKKPKASIGDKIGAFGGGGLSSLTLGASDFLEAGLASVVPVDRLVAPDGSADIRFGKFRNNLNEVRERNRKQKEGAPVAHTAGQVGGAVLGLSKLNAAKALPSQVLARAGNKLPLAGKLNGFGRSTAATVTDGVGIAATQAAFNGDNVLDAGAQGGAISAATNTLLRGAGTPIANALKNSRITQAPTTKALRDAKNAAFDKVKEFGAEFSPQQIQGLLGRIEKQIPQGGLGGISQATHPTTATALQRLQSNANAPALLDDLQVFRSNLSASPLNKPDKRLAGKIRTELDNFTATQQPARVTGGTGKEANEALLSARSQNRTFEQSKALDKIEERVGLSTANKNGRKDEAISASLRSILNSPKKSRQFDKEHLAEMRRIIQGGPLQNAGRNAASFDPTSGGIKGLFTGASLFSPAAPLTGALGGLGLLGRAGINARTTKDFAKLAASIRRGGGPEISPSQLEAMLGNPAHSEAAARLVTTFAGNQ